ncbi:hypothetical protein [Kibdelosporangium philippinense]
MIATRVVLSGPQPHSRSRLGIARTPEDLPSPRASPSSISRLTDRY